MKVERPVTRLIGWRSDACASDEDALNISAACRKYFATSVPDKIYRRFFFAFVTDLKTNGSEFDPPWRHGHAREYVKEHLI